VRFTLARLRKDFAYFILYKLGKGTLRLYNITLGKAYSVLAGETKLRRDEFVKA
jgi:hypothetical protein